MGAHVVSDYLTPEAEQAEEDAAIAAGEDRAEEQRHAARERALTNIREYLDAVTAYGSWRDVAPIHRPGNDCEGPSDVALSPFDLQTLTEWVDELRRSHQAQQDRITALLTAVDYFRPPF